MTRYLLTICLLSALCGCKQPITAPTLQPPKVTVTKPIQRDVQLFHEFTGRTAAVEQAEIRARVQGFLKSIHFKDSDFVEAGQLLFVIEQEPFQASLKLAQSDLESNRAGLKLAEANFARGRALIDNRAISAQELDVMEAEVMQSDAAISGAEAVVDDAQLQLDYTSVESPIAGRIDRNLVDVGNLVGAEGKTLLANVVRLDPIHAYFDIDERTFLNHREERGDTGSETQADFPPVLLARQNDKDFPFSGMIDFVDNEFDGSTGTILARGVFPNPKGKLVPGMFVRLRIPKEVESNALLVEEQAIGTDMSGKYLLLLGKDNLVELRRVELGPAKDNLRVIESGLSADDEYIIEGLQRARPGLPVSPERATTAPPAAATSASPTEPSAEQ